MELRVIHSEFRFNEPEPSDVEKLMDHFSFFDLIHIRSIRPIEPARRSRRRGDRSLGDRGDRRKRVIVSES